MKPRSKDSKEDVCNFSNPSNKQPTVTVDVPFTTSGRKYATVPEKHIMPKETFISYMRWKLYIVRSWVLMKAVYQNIFHLTLKWQHAWFTLWSGSTSQETENKFNFLFYKHMHTHIHTNLNVISCDLNTTGLAQHSELLPAKCNLLTEGKTARMTEGKRDLIQPPTSKSWYLNH